MIVDRKSGELFQEEVYFGSLLKFLYAPNLFSRLLRAFIAKNSFVSKICGGWQSLPWTRHKIVPFIKKYGLDPSEFEKTHFFSFNDFFTRKLKREARPILGEICMPADGRYLVYPDNALSEGFLVKGEKFSLETLLQDSQLAKKYAHGGMVIARLAPVDYHRFHFPLDAIPGEAKLINGYLYSVNPLAIKQNIHRFTQNKRVITKLKSEIGTILCIEVGATNVGTIKQTYTPERAYRAGDEKGYFSFGGSALILLFPPKRVEFDEMLVHNSRQYFETRCLMGQVLARRL